MRLHEHQQGSGEQQRLKRRYQRRNAHQHQRIVRAAVVKIFQNIACTQHQIGDGQVDVCRTGFVSDFAFRKAYRAENYAQCKYRDG